jgi:hypothetical protein
MSAGSPRRWITKPGVSAAKRPSATTGGSNTAGRNVEASERVAGIERHLVGGGEISAKTAGNCVGRGQAAELALSGAALATSDGEVD